MSASPPPETLLAAIREVVGNAPSIPLHEPLFAGQEWRYVKKCLDSGWVSSAGGFVTEFEQRLAAYTGAANVVATSSGTSALHLALVAVGVRPEDEVLLPALTFVATANAVKYCHAVPHFVDIEPATLGVDPAALAEHLRRTAVRDTAAGCWRNRDTGRRLAALIVVHAFGHPARTNALAAVCQEYDLPLVEDAAEALGSWRGGRHAGTTGRVGVLSFNGNKIITTGGGGAVLTADAGLAARIRHLATTAKQPHPWEYHHDAIGYNYRMPNLNAALGCAQLQALPGLLAKKRHLAERYAARLAPLAGVTFVAAPQGTTSNYWLNTILLTDPAQRSPLLTLAHEQGIGLRPAWTPLHQLPMYLTAPKANLSRTENLAARIVNLPSSPGLPAI